MLNLLVIRSANLEAAEAFYRALGFQFEKHRHGKGLPHLAAESDGFVFEIYPQLDKSTSETRIGFAVTSVAETIETLITLGGEIVSSPRQSEWGYRAVIKDLDGHSVELTEKCSKKKNSRHSNQPE